MLAVSDPSVLKSDYVLPPDYEIMTETTEVFTKALLLGMEPETGKNNFADDVDVLPFEEAVAYMRKRLPVDEKTYYALADKMRYRAFTVSRLADGDAVRQVQSMLVKAMDKGSGIQQFLQLTEGQLADAAGMGRGAGWYYETVYRTNTATAYNVGRAIGFEETPPIALELIGIDDARQTEICHSLTVPPFRRPYGDPVWEHMWPPFHFNCRTTVRAIYDESEIEEAGGPYKFYSKGTPDYTPDKGFGAYPLDKSDKWWDMTDSMKNRAEEYGLTKEFEDAKEKLIEPENAGPAEPLSENNTAENAIPGELDIMPKQLLESAENVLGIKSGSPMPVADALKGTNPKFTGYEEMNAYNQNCQRDVVAYFLRRLGFDVEAGPFPFNDPNNQISSANDVFLSQSGKNTYFAGEKNKKELISRLQSFPDGAMFGVDGTWKKGGKHVFAAEKIRGKIYFVDPQNNMIDASVHLANMKELRFFRADDRILKPSLDYSKILEVKK